MYELNQTLIVGLSVLGLVNIALVLILCKKLSNLQESVEVEAMCVLRSLDSIVKMNAETKNEISKVGKNINGES